MFVLLESRRTGRVRRLLMHEGDRWCLGVEKRIKFTSCVAQQHQSNTSTGFRVSPPTHSATSSDVSSPSPPSTFPSSLQVQLQIALFSPFRGSLRRSQPCLSLLFVIFSNPRPLAAWLMTVCLLCTNKSFLTFLHLCLFFSFSSLLPCLDPFSTGGHLQYTFRPPR